MEIIHPATMVQVAGNVAVGPAIHPSMKTVFMDVLWMWDYDDNDMTEKWMDRTNWFHQGGINSQIRVDPIEVTNENGTKLHNGYW